MENNSYVIIHGMINIKELNKALEKWIELYYNQLTHKTEFEIYKITKSEYVILSTKKIENEIFNYLINYLKYPENITYDVTVKGYTNVNNNELYSKISLNERIEVFISDADKDFDTVQIITNQNESFVHSFSGNVYPTKQKKTFDEKKLSLSKSQRINSFIVDRKDVNKNITKKTETDVLKRYNKYLKLFIIIQGISALALMASFFNKEIIIGLSVLLFIWIQMDYITLSKFKFYIGFLLLSMSIIGMNIYFNGNNYQVIESTEIGFFSILFPRTVFSFLLLQPLFRFLFIIIFKHEPDFNSRHTRRPDDFFSVSLLVASISIAIYSMGIF